MATIANNKDVYLAQLKANRSGEPSKRNVRRMSIGPTNFKKTEYQKGHGRVKTRQYKGYDFVASQFDERWKETKSVSLIVVSQELFSSKTKKSTHENSY